MEDTFAERVIGFNRGLSFKGHLPRGIRLMNPFREGPGVSVLSEAFYRKFYGDTRKRKLILGINPGRLGAGATGIPFTDTKRLASDCGIGLAAFHTHEPSSVFVYDVIRQYGGPTRFYRDFFINSMSPLGLLIQNKKGNWVNCNYYDFPELYAAMRPFISNNLKEIVSLGIDTSICHVLGKKNFRYLQEINKSMKLFKNIEVLDHPRYIVQYKAREKEAYLEAYLNTLGAPR